MRLALNQEITNQELFNTIVKESLAKASNYPRWQNAINKGVTQMSLNPFISWDDDAKGLIILSMESNNIYASNGVCQCKAFERNQPCWHRALARLVRLYFEAQVEFELHTAECQERLAQDNALYQKRQPETTKIGGYRI